MSEELEFTLQKLVEVDFESDQSFFLQHLIISRISAGADYFKK
jgi:hypothetical protein